MSFDAKHLRLTAITDRHLCTDLVDTTRALIQGGVTAVMLREKDLATDVLTILARSLCALCHAADTLFLVNGNLEAALACGADGVHLGSGDPSPAEARALGGDRLVYGVSVHTLAELQPAYDGGADYACLAPIFPPNSKSSTRPPLGLEVLAQATAATRLPILALGGIDAEREAACFKAGAAGVAAIGALYGASRPQGAARTFTVSRPQTTSLPHDAV